jgi:chemotaxis protein methyltransferase CheR
MASLELSPQVFTILCGLIEEHAGLHYDLLDRPIVAEKLTPRAVERGFESLLDYYYYLRYDPGGTAELDALVESLLVHETYFFRELDQLETLVKGPIRDRINRGERPRVWCAACATGEEPISLAALLAEHDLLGRVDLLATDLSARALERARRGEFNGRATRALPPAMSRRWFVEQNGALVPVAGLRESITWRQVNLVNPLQVAALGTFHAILCRNVLIYFRDETAHKVVSSLSGALEPGGHLLVGASESLLRFGTSLRCEERGGTFFYEKVV